MNATEYTLQFGIRAKACKLALQSCDKRLKNDCLIMAAELLLSNANKLIQANIKDVDNAVKKNLKKAMIDRLILTEKSIKNMADGIRQIVGLDDYCNETESEYVTKENLKISKILVPFGVIGIIFESRPNVASDTSALCIKSGNCVILRGGSEAINTNLLIAKYFRQALKAVGLPEDCVQIIDDTDREIVKEMLSLNSCIDLIIPRGSSSLINFVVSNASVPVIETGAGNCHIYVDSNANFDMAINIIENAKVQKPSVCNAVEKVLVHKDIAEIFLPQLVDVLIKNNVVVKGDINSQNIDSRITEAIEEDWYAEYNDYIIGIKIVESINKALTHIEKYSTKHSEAIITNDEKNANIFLNSVDSACVYVNASTRFTDGEVFGLGSEIGISTQKLHARGPMGLKALMTTKYLIYGNGQVRK